MVNLTELVSGRAGIWFQTLCLQSESSQPLRCTASHLSLVVSWQMKMQTSRKGELFDNHEWKRGHSVEGQKQM